MLPDAESSNEMNWHSVALRASSDMLLTRPILRQPAGSESNKTGIRVSLRSDQGGGVESLLQIFNDVVAVLDPYAEANHFRHNAGLALLFRRHLPVRGGGGMARYGFGIPRVDS